MLFPANRHANLKKSPSPDSSVDDRIEPGDGEQLRAKTGHAAGLDGISIGLRPQPALRHLDGKLILSGFGSGPGPARHKVADVVCGNDLRHEHDARPVDKALELSLLVRAPQANLQSISDTNVAYFRQPLGAPWS
ncbi:hypothetical protein MGU_07046 [Metarhizium guizhouense ARSEF 977]|uniref:Uncharacterized protein n=1 Tax=Metarhizium guizhouense (strain ARSEF 977) TaxID=1276136 RepID=A0A0B4GSV2_METGA|nr:hypothetical protein MGU_07046 [Metarhizium guizhouense ARSEF 977]